MSVIKPQKQQAQGVGSTFGARREFQKTQSVSPAPARPAQHQALDKFMGGSKKPANLGVFNPNAMFKAAKTRFSGVGSPYKRPLHDYIEQGQAQMLTSNVQRPSDSAILRFLDRVIESQPAHGARAARPTGSPVAPARSPVRKS